jgi:hypothetical protein
MKHSGLVTVLLSSYISAFSILAETPNVNAKVENQTVKPKTNLQAQVNPWIRYPGRLGNPLPNRYIDRIQPIWKEEIYYLTENDWGGYFYTNQRYEMRSTVTNFCNVRTNSAKRLVGISTRGFGRCIFRVRTDYI